MNSAKPCTKCDGYYPGDCTCENKFPKDCTCDGCNTMRALSKSKSRKDKRILEGFYHAQRIYDFRKREKIEEKEK